MKKIALLTFVFAFVITGCKTKKYADLSDGIYADIQTNKGDIVLKLYHEATPVTVANFVSLAEGENPFVSDEYKEKKYYDGIIFHRVIKDFMIQGGDPTGTGSGSPGYKFKDEFVDSLKNIRGNISMANSGPKTNGSQFFIVHKDSTPWLNGKHTVFGEVVQGMDVVDTIANVKVLSGSKPEKEVVMNTVEIVRKGKSAKQFDAVQVMTDYFDEAEREIAAFKKMKEDMAAKFNVEMETAEATNSGLKILKITNGEGEQPKVGQKASVNYAGYFLTNGELFDTNILEIAKKYQKVNPGRRDQGGYAPMPMDYSPEARMIPGFKEGLMTMKVGDKIRLFIPPHLGYGDNDYGPIPGGSTLVFDLEITGIVE